MTQLSGDIRVPTALKKGDQVAIVAPAKYIHREYIERAKALFESWGLVCRVGEHATGKFRVFSGTDEERTSDMQWALDHPELKAIFCARGGYGTIRIIDRLNFTQFKNLPKWIVGFSDITVLHNHLHTHWNTASLHATVPLNFPERPKENKSLRTLKEVLFGQRKQYEIAAHQGNRMGQCTAPVVGGNLSILHNLAGTNSDLDTRGKILFIEEVAEYAYHFDRMLWGLKKAGKFDGLAGLLVGGLTEIKQGPNPFGASEVEIIREIVQAYSYPVAFGFPAGHQKENWCLPLGTITTLDVTDSKTTLTTSPYGTTQ